MTKSFRGISIVVVVAHRYDVPNVAWPRCASDRLLKVLVSGCLVGATCATDGSSYGAPYSTTERQLQLWNYRGYCSAATTEAMLLYYVPNQKLGDVVDAARHAVEESGLLDHWEHEEFANDVAVVDHPELGTPVMLHRSTSI